MVRAIGVALLASVVRCCNGAAQNSWVLKEGFNCYEFRGATNIDIYPIGTLTIADCQAKCEETSDCTAITFMHGGDANSGNCWRRKDINLDRCKSKSEQYNTWLREAAPVESRSGWAQERDFNCYSGHGAEEIDHDSLGSLSVAACQDKCNMMAECTGITFMTGATKTSCWRRKHINLAKCLAGPSKHSKKYDTWIKRPTPAPTPAPVPSEGFPTTRPQFIRGFIEGLNSDNGDDAKDCEKKAAAFASAVGTLAETAVGEVKSVAAAVDTAMKTCAVVAQDAEKLALNTIEDIFHPSRVTKNYEATRTDVLDMFGKAVELMAQKDFRGAGGKVGMASRRIIEGPQNTKWQSSAKHQDYGALFNQDAGNSSTPNLVASVAVFAVTHWGAASLAHGSESTIANWGGFLAGVLEGLMSDGTDLSDCIGEASKVGRVLEQAMEHVGKTLADVKKVADIARSSCDTLAVDTWKLAKAAFNDILHPDQVIQNVQATQYDFLMEVGGSLQALAKNDDRKAGTLMGMAIRRALEGAQGAKAVTMIV